MKRRRKKPVRRRGLTRKRIIKLLAEALEETNARLTRIETRYAQLEQVLATLESAAKESRGRLGTAIGGLEHITSQQYALLKQAKRYLE